MMKTSASRTLDIRYIQRAERIPASDVGEHLESITISLHRALDSWRHNSGPAEDVTMCVDALAALWSVVERRIAV